MLWPDEASGIAVDKAGIIELFPHVHVAAIGIQDVITTEEGSDVLIEVGALQKLHETFAIGKKVMRRSSGVSVYSILYLDGPPVFIGLVQISF